MTNLDIFFRVITPFISALVGAVLAFMHQRKTELKRDKRHVLQALMIFRNVGVEELEFIKALNAVDVVFHDNKKVTQLCHTYFDQLDPKVFHTLQWRDTFHEMLYAMAQSVGYKNLTKDDIRRFYAPNALDLHYPRPTLPEQPKA
jgi:hypothetical protein